jgi:hypothetical protein
LALSTWILRIYIIYDFFEWFCDWYTAPILVKNCLKYNDIVINVSYGLLLYIGDILRWCYVW